MFPTRTRIAPFPRELSKTRLSRKFCFVLDYPTPKFGHGWGKTEEGSNAVAFDPGKVIGHQPCLVSFPSCLSPSVLVRLLRCDLVTQQVDVWLSNGPHPTPLFPRHHTQARVISSYHSYVAHFTYV